MPATNVYAIILAGGRGERFWPASRINYPKHFLKMWGKRSFLQETFYRIKSFIPRDHVFIVTTQDQTTLVKKQIPGIKNKNLIIEPLSRNTAAAIGLASIFINEQNPEAVIVVAPSDHHISPPSNFTDTIKNAVILAQEKKAIVSLGIKPTYPSPGYGYIKIADSVQRSAFRGNKFYEVDKFIEKPSLPLAKKFIRDKSYFWNSGIFVFPASVMLENFRIHYPKLYASLREIKVIWPKKNKTKATKIYSRLNNISIDYAVMEKTAQLYMMEAKFNWDDVGSWGSLARYLPLDKYKNVIPVAYQGINTKNCIVVGQPNHLIGTIGLKDTLIVQTKDATLVCSRNSLENIKALVKNLASDKNLKRYLQY